MKKVLYAAFALLACASCKDLFSADSGETISGIYTRHWGGPTGYLWDTLYVAWTDNPGSGVYRVVRRQQRVVMDSNGRLLAPKMYVIPSKAYYSRKHQLLHLWNTGEIFHQSGGGHRLQNDQVVFQKVQ